MSLKIKQIIKKILYISTFSLVFIFIFTYFNTSADTTNNKNVWITEKEWKIEYKDINIKPIAQVWVAITTNIWMWNFKDWKIEETNINKEIFSVEDFYLKNPKIKYSLIKTNMIFIKEYFNIMKTNFADIIKKSKNKEQTLNNLLRQLKIRYNNAQTNIANLKKQKSILSTEYEKISTQISSIKKKLEYDFNKSLVDEVFKDVDLYYSLKEKETILKTNIIFINNFLNKYAILNKYNYNLINALSLNKDIISKDSYLVIPNSGTKILKEFELLYSEDEYKAIKNEE